MGVLRTFNRVMKKNHKEKKLSSGRKKKADEEDYIEMIHKIITKMRGSAVKSKNNSNLGPSYKSEQLSKCPSTNAPKGQNSISGIKPQTKENSTSMNTNISEKEPTEMENHSIIDLHPKCYFQEDVTLGTNIQFNWNFHSKSE
jgi:hypothetical protein